MLAINVYTQRERNIIKNILSGKVEDSGITIDPLKLAVGTRVANEDDWNEMWWKATRFCQALQKMADYNTAELPEWVWRGRTKITAYPSLASGELKHIHPVAHPKTMNSLVNSVADLSTDEICTIVSLLPSDVVASHDLTSLTFNFRPFKNDRGEDSVIFWLRWTGKKFTTPNVMYFGGLAKNHTVYPAPSQA